MLVIPERGHATEANKDNGFHVWHKTRHATPRHDKKNRTHRCVEAAPKSFTESQNGTRGALLGCSSFERAAFPLQMPKTYGLMTITRCRAHDG